MFILNVLIRISSSNVTHGQKLQGCCWHDTKYEGWTAVVKFFTQRKRLQEATGWGGGKKVTYTPLCRAQASLIKCNLLSLTSTALYNNLWSNLSSTGLVSFLSAPSIQLIPPEKTLLKFPGLWIHLWHFQRLLPQDATFFPPPGSEFSFIF